MGRPEKLTKEQQAEAVSKIGQKPKQEICAEYGISELTLRRYEKAAKLQAETLAGQVAEQRMTAQEVAQEMNPPEAA